MTDDEFELLIERGIRDIQPELRALMNNVAIVIADEPTEEQLAEHKDDGESTLFGLYEGVPLTERGIEGVLFPDKITIFKTAILAENQTEEDIAECVSNTVWHEVAHHFGYDEEWIAAEEEHRGKTL